MNVIFSNPLGLWALLGIPAVLAIHFLQERSRRMRVSTLFLLEHMAPESVAGMRFEKLRQSVPLWLQLLAVLLLTWMWCEPRWIRADSRQTVVVVLDSSVSMSAFKEPTRRLLEQKLEVWAKGAAHTDWRLLESDPRKGTLFAGEDRKGLLAAYDAWQPEAGTHEFEEVLWVARGLVKDAGRVVLVTDHQVAAGLDVAVLAVGEKLENVGFAGGTVEVTAHGGMKWRALVRNYGESPAKRQWWMERMKGDGGTERAGEVRELVLQPGQTLELKGELPPSEDRALAVMEGDAFVWDDRLPMQLPKERVLKAQVRLAGKAGEMLSKMLEAAPHLVLIPAGGERCLTVAEWGTLVAGDAILTGRGDESSGRLDGAFTVAEEHPLTRGLNWMGLLTGKPKELALQEGDEPLLWKGGRVLALMRSGVMDGRITRQLILNWDIEASNAAREPAVLVLLQRFVELLREDLDEAWAGNFECGQVLPAPSQAAGGWELTMNGQREKFAGRAPRTVGFFEVSAQGEPWLQGALQFADTREADFSEAAQVDVGTDGERQTLLKQTEVDPFLPLWLLGLLACLLGAWGWKKG